MGLTAKQKQILDGLLLGDGCLFIGKHNKNPLLTVARAEKDLKYLEYHYSIFEKFCSDEGIISSDKTDNSAGKIYKGYKFRTRSLPELLPAYQRWYKAGTKIVPRDLILSPLVLATWFCDDGSISPKTNRDGTKGPALILKLSTNSFSKNEVEFLASSLSEKFGEDFKIYHDSLEWYKKRNPHYVIDQNKNWYIKTYSPGARKFFQEIKKSFPLGMDRKLHIFKEHIDGRLGATSC